MSGSVRNRPGCSGENADREFIREQDDKDGELMTGPDTEGLFDEIERFVRLGSDLKECLSRLVYRIKEAMNSLNTIEKAVEQKKSELKRIRDIELTAAALDELMEQHHLRKAEFESFMEAERLRWEAEKASREKEDGEYREALILRRRREEESYRLEWAGKQEAARKEFEENLRAVQREKEEKLKAVESDLLRREQAIKEKESEYARLVRELDNFMTGLLESARKKSGAGGESVGDGNPSVETIREALLSRGGRIQAPRENTKETRSPMPFRISSSPNNR